MTKEAAYYIDKGNLYQSLYHQEETYDSLDKLQVVNDMDRLTPEERGHINELRLGYSDRDITELPNPYGYNNDHDRAHDSNVYHTNTMPGRSNNMENASYNIEKLTTKIKNLVEKLESTFSNNDTSNEKEQTSNEEQQTPI